MRVLRTILVLVLIVLRPVLLAVLWPFAALVRFVTFLSPLVLLFLVVILLHTSNPEQHWFAWSLIATMAGLALASAGLTGLQRKLREDPTLLFRRHLPNTRPVDLYGERSRGPGSAIQAYPHPLSHLRRR